MILPVEVIANTVAILTEIAVMLLTFNACTGERYGTGILDEDEVPKQPVLGIPHLKC